MNSLKDFINQGHGKNLISQNELVHTITSVVKPLSIINASNSEKEKFGEAVIQLATNDEVLTELSKTVGNPHSDESEDEFVKRAKSMLSNILHRKLEN